MNTGKTTNHEQEEEIYNLHSRQAIEAVTSKRAEVSGSDTDYQRQSSTASSFSSPFDDECDVKGPNEQPSVQRQLHPQMKDMRKPLGKNSQFLNARDQVLSQRETDEAFGMRDLRWAALLERRPTDGDGEGLTSWLKEVMTVSAADASLSLNEDFRSSDISELSNGDFLEDDEDDDDNDIAGLSSVSLSACSSDSEEYPEVQSNLYKRKQFYDGFRSEHSGKRQCR